jgi:hypothetical protein
VETVSLHVLFAKIRKNIWKYDVCNKKAYSKT